MSAAEGKKAPKAPERSIDEIEAELASTRTRLVGTLGELEDRLSPPRAFARMQVRAREVYLPDGGIRWDRVAYTAAAVGAGVVALGVTTRTLRWILAIPHRRTPEVVYIPVLRDQLAALQLPVD